MVTETLETTTQIEQLIESTVRRVVEEQLEAKFSDISAQLQAIQEQLQNHQAGSGQLKDKVTIVVASNEIDRLMPALIIATGAASFGMEVSLFFTLWGTNALRVKTVYENKSFMEKMMTFMMPSKPERGALTQMNFLGAGSAMMKMMMKKHNVATIPELMDLAADMGVKMIACQMTMGLMGITPQELRSDVEYGGVAKYIEDAAESKITLFI